MFAHLLHIRPWEIGLLDITEFYALCDAIDEYVKKMREAGSG